MVNEVEVEDPNAEPDKEYVYSIEHEVQCRKLEPKWLRSEKKKKKRKQPGNGTQEPKTKQPGDGTQEPMKVW